MLSCFRNPVRASKWYEWKCKFLFMAHKTPDNLTSVNHSKPLPFCLTYASATVSLRLQGFCAGWLLYLKCPSQGHHMAGSFSSVRSGFMCAPIFLISPVGRNLWSDIIVQSVSSKAIALLETLRLEDPWGKGRLWLYYSLLYIQFLAQCLGHNRLLINICEKFPYLAGVFSWHVTMVKLECPNLRSSHNWCLLIFQVIRLNCHFLKKANSDHPVYSGQSPNPFNLIPS